MKIIGITGGVGAGKSEIINYIKSQYSCRVIFADEVAKKLQLPGEICFEPVLHILGNDVLREDGCIDKAKMAHRIFEAPDLLKQVNAVIHPAVKTYIKCAIAEEKEKGNYDFFIIEAALLIEEGYKQIVDELWYIYASEAVRTARLVSSRGYSETKIKQIFARQLPEETFREQCDFVIDNSTSLGEAKKQIDKRLEGYLCQK